MNKIEWEKWGYENNAPMALIKTGFNHALVMSLAVILMSIVFAMRNYEGMEKFFYFSILTLLTTSMFFVISLVPFILMHGLHYKIFKKVLLYKKLEYSILIAWLIVFTHFSIFYYSIDYLVFKFNLVASAIEYTFLFTGYIVGLLVSFKIFHKDFYIKSKIITEDVNVWKKHISKEENYF